MAGAAERDGVRRIRTIPQALVTLILIALPGFTAVASAQTPLPDGQLVIDDDLTLHLGGTWDDPGTCGVNIPEDASCLCQFSGIDRGGDPQALMIGINRHGAGDGVSLESWSQVIEDRRRRDSETAPGGATRHRCPSGHIAWGVTAKAD